MRIILATIFATVGFAGVLQAAEPVGIAGLHPERRPVWAPVTVEFKKTGVWYDIATEGVSEPYPASLRFLENQGGWFTPFNHPGMTGHYDIRGWHSGQ